MKKENSRESPLHASGKTDKQGGKESSLSSSRQVSNRQENDNGERTDTAVRKTKPQPPPVRVIIEGGRPDG